MTPRQLYLSQPDADENLVEEKRVDFEKIGRADLACRNALRLAYHWQTRSPGWRLSFAPSDDLDLVYVTLHRRENAMPVGDVPIGSESIPVDNLDWRLPDNEIYREIATAGNRLLAAWIKSYEDAAASAQLQSGAR